MNKVVYIGVNQDYIANFNRFLNGLIVLNNYSDITKIHSSHPNIDCILYERKNISRDIEVLQSIKKVYPKTCFILISETAVPKEETTKYLAAGVISALSPNATNEAVDKIFEYIKKRESFASRKKGNESREMQSFKMPIGKRLFDIVMALGALTILSPLFIVVMLLIRIESKGPIIYKSKRVGSNYKIFDFLKFRSMYPDADKRLKEYLALNQYGQNTETKGKDEDRIEENNRNESGDNATVLVADDYVIPEDKYIEHRRTAQENAFIKYKNDPRITKVGRIIRKYSIDELPQLINILKGDMSFVGNRPLPLYEAELLTTDNYIDRFIAPAGLTGLWQVEKRGGSAVMSAEERKQLDIFYAKNCSFLFDMKIIFKTIFNFIQKEDV